MNLLNSFFEILIMSTPLLLIATGTLFSELCGILAVFCDGIVNLGAFLFFLFTYLTHKQKFRQLGDYNIDHLLLQKDFPSG